MKQIIKNILLFSSFVGLISCDAPRLNPLDPFNPESRMGKVDGYVLTSTREPVADAKVVWKNQNVLATTDSTGYYVIDDIMRDDGMIYFEKEGLGKDSSFIRWNNQKNIRVEEKLLSYTIGKLDGFVYASPRTAVSGIKVIWKNLNIITETNSLGYYQFENISITDGYILFEKEGLQKDSVYVEWNGQSIVRAGEKSLNYTIGELDGFVYGIPREALSGVRIIWKNTNTITNTNASGYYKLTNVPIKDGLLYFEKEGLKKDSVYVEWNSQRILRVQEKTLIYEISFLDGFVRTLSFPRVPISGVKVFWKNQSILVYTDITGYYSFENLSQKNGWLFFEKEGYSKDSVYVEFENQKSKRVDEKLLNKNPVVEEFNIYTIVQNRFPNIQFMRLGVQTSISDAEGDVDRVFISCTSLNFLKQLEYNPSTRLYEGRYTLSDLNILYIDEAVGKNFEIIVEDRADRNFHIGNANIKRIIKEEVIPVSPLNRQIVSSTPTLRWTRFTPGFNFYFTVQIFTDEVSPTKVWEKNFVSKDAIDITTDIDIPSGEYYWLISCVDDFLNTTISKPASFIVQ